jgi:alanine racemase
MTLRLTVDRAAWLRHVHDVAGWVDGLVPVVKGNGYGFGRATLHAVADTIANDVCVGTVHELDGIPDGLTPVVLTPTLEPPTDTSPVLTVGSPAHVDAIAGWRGRVVVKLRSSMQRFGTTPDELPNLQAAALTAGLDVVGTSLHLALAGDDGDRLAEVERWLAHLDPALPLWLSHLGTDAFSALQHRHPARTFRLRLGTALWHGDKSFLHLSADVLDAHPVTVGEVAGYRHRRIDAPGAIVVVGAGSAHGIGTLPDGRSPFHFARRRLALLEPPHMHSSMTVVRSGDPCPVVADRVDVQWPLITTRVDETVWLP